MRVTEEEAVRILAKAPKRPVLGELGVNKWTTPSEMPKPAKRQKFNAQKTQASDGVWCDSKAEARRWEELKLMQRAGQIEYMLPHPSFPLFVNGKRTGRMTFDAMYVEAGGKMILEDTKSAVTAKQTAYKQRLRTFQACYPHITVREHIV